MFFTPPVNRSGSVPPAATGPEISQCCTVVFDACRTATPKLAPPPPRNEITQSDTVTPSPVTLTVPATRYPENTAPSPVTSTQPPAFHFHPEPLFTSPGTSTNFVPAGTPADDPSGKPHATGATAQRLRLVGATEPCDEGNTVP